MKFLNYIKRGLALILVIFSLCLVFPSPSYATTLEGSVWKLKSGLGPTQVSNSDITIKFKDGSFSGSTGCNSYGGEYTLESKDKTSGKIKLSNTSNTFKLCSGEVGEQEVKFLTALEKVKEYQLTDKGLVLPYPSPSRYLLFTQQ